MKVTKLTQVQEKILACMKRGNEIHIDNNVYKLDGYDKTIQRATVESLVNQSRLKKQNNRYILVGDTASKITTELNKPQKQKRLEQRDRDKLQKQQDQQAQRETRNNAIQLLCSGGQLWLDAGVDDPELHDAANGRLTRPWSMRVRYKDGEIQFERSTLYHIANNCRRTSVNTDLYHNISTYCDVYGLSSHVGQINWIDDRLSYAEAVNGFAEIHGCPEPVWHTIGEPLNTDLHYTQLTINGTDYAILYADLTRRGHRTALRMYEVIKPELFSSLGGNKINCATPNCRANYRQMKNNTYRMYARNSETQFVLDPNNANLIGCEEDIKRGRLNYDKHGIMRCLRCLGPLLHPYEHWDNYGYKRPFNH